MSKIQNTSSLTQSPSHLVTQLLRRQCLGIVGAGNMGQAILNGLVQAGVPGKHLTVVEADARKRQHAMHRSRATTASVEMLPTRCNVIVLAVKPQEMSPVLAVLWRALARLASGQRPLIISIAAGLTVASLQRALGHCPLIRVMPNLPAQVGCGMSAITAGRWAMAAHRRLARAIFESVGEVVELPERLFDVVTAVSGSGPAYYFLIFKALRDAAVEAGMPAAVAQRLAVQTACGSACLVSASTDALETWIARVASKKGTTEAALKVFTTRKLAEVVQAGVRAARRRSQELTRCLS